MNILFADTTTNDLVVAVIRERDVVSVVVRDADRRHSELLCSEIDRVLTQAGVAFADLDAYACAIGPGSFTGIRIGVSTVKGYQTAVPRPYIAINCLQAIACSEQCGSRKSAVIDAGNGYYFADYAHGVAPTLIGYDDERAVAAGRGSASRYFDGAVSLVRKRFAQGDFDSELDPLYIRRSQAEENRK